MSSLLLANHGVFRRGKTFAPSLDIQAHVGTSLSPTSTGNRAVTGVGFTPKAVMPFGTSQQSAGGELSALLSFGAGLSSSNRSGVSVSSNNAVTTSSTWRRHDDSRIVGAVNTLGADFLFSDLNALGSDGFTLNWSTVQATERILNHICLGGADLEVSLTQHQMNATNADQSFAHGLTGGAPTGLMVFSANSTTSPPFTESVLTSGIGAWSEGNQFATQVYSNNAQTTTNTGRSLVTTGILSLFGVAKTISRVMSVASVDATNVNATYPVTSLTNQLIFWLLAIRGAKCQVGTFDCNGSLSPLTINTPGITPRLFLPVFVPAGVDNVNTVQNGLELTIGASDGTRNVSCGITDANGVTTTNARRYQNSTALQEFNNAGTSVFSATAAFSGQSVVLTPTVNSSSAFGQGGFLVVGS